MNEVVAAIESINFAILMLGVILICFLGVMAFWLGTIANELKNMRSRIGRL